MNVAIISVTLFLPFWKSGVGVTRLWRINPQRLIAHVSKSTTPNSNGAEGLAALCQSWRRSVKMELWPTSFVGCKFKQRVFRNSAVHILLVKFRSLHEELNFSIFFPTTSFLELLSFQWISACYNSKDALVMSMEAFVLRNRCYKLLMLGFWSVHSTYLARTWLFCQRIVRCVPRYITQIVGSSSGERPSWSIILPTTQHLISKVTTPVLWSTQAPIQCLSGALFPGGKAARLWR
jgi:hypothetical protein